MVLHAAEDDDAVAGRFDLVAEDLEAVAEAEAGDLAFDQPLGGLRQRPLRLANADRQRAALGLAGLDQKLAEEMRFSRAAAAVRALVARGRQQRLENLAVGIFRMDNDTLDSVDQFKRAVIAVLDGLRRLAPAAVQDGVGGGDRAPAPPPWCCA